ncbi:MAG TPA: M20 family metallo-hydrolase [Gemmatimonadales bacterium]|nr:M20 family metallo-hydrolase [Gemmatimonadales bacterium]
MHRRDFNRTLLSGTAALALPGLQHLPAALRVDAARISLHLTALSQFGKNPQGGVSRVAYTDADRLGREAALGWMREAELAVSIDAAGNLVGRRPGRDASLKPLVLGSHIDSVPSGGNYDGDVGSLSAIEVARTLAVSGTVLRHPLEVILFENEEGGTTGSHALATGLTAADLDVVSQSGKTIREGIRFLGGDPDRLASVRRAKGDIAAYLELHIEQGGTLDEAKLPIGVVLGIVGIRHWEVTVEGFANHAGTTPMNRRRDALLVAARCIDIVNRTVRSIPGRQVGTVGWLRVEPGAYNVIPGKVVFGLELRDLEDAKIRELFQRIRGECLRLAREGGTTISFQESPRANAPALTDPKIRRTIADAARRMRLATLALPSGAGHDAQEMARLGPVGMIFIPSVGGISHSPKEFSRPGDIENGANVLLQTLLALDAQ